MLVSCQKSHDWVVLLQICIPIDDNSLVPPAVLLPGDVIGVLRIVLLRKQTYIYSTFVDNRMGFERHRHTPEDKGVQPTSKAWPFAASLMQ